ncbi:MAG TPA: hypothetical protein VFD20_04300 [Demequina sp.]|nr:hypothetical protein [Demequina sp.]
MLCVAEGARILGDIELGRFPAEEDLQEGADVASALRRRAEDFLSGFRNDRAAGCPGFVLTPMAVTDASVGGVAAIRTGFVLETVDGRAVERVVIYLALHDGTLWAVNASAYVAEGGCLAPEGADFSPGELQELEPYLDTLVAATPLPDADASPS